MKITWKGVYPAVTTKFKTNGKLDIPTYQMNINAQIEAGVDAILENLGDGPLVFNLGHGITPDADPDNVQRMIDTVRGG